VSPRRRRLVWGAALLVVVPLACLALLLLAANTGPGRRAAERLTGQLSGGRVVVSGLAGDPFGELHLARLELRDAQGAWLTATDITLQASPGQLLWRHAQLRLLRAGAVRLARAPVAAVPSAPRGDRSPLLRRLDVGQLEIARLEIAAVLAGADAALDLHGSLHVGAADDARATLSARRLDGPGDYQLEGQMDATRVGARIDVHEPAGGPLANLAGLPGLGELSLQLRIEGPRTAEAAHLTLAAGSLHAAADGTVDWVSGIADLDVTAASPAMTLRPDLSWDGLSLQAHYHGAFTAPAVTAQLEVDGARFGNVGFQRLNADIRGQAGIATAAATLEGLRVPGPRPLLFAASTVGLSMAVHLSDPARPVTFSLSHPLVSVRGSANAGEPRSAAFTATLPSITPFADVLGLDLHGQGTIAGTLAGAHDEVQATVAANLRDVSGSGLSARLIGSVATLNLTVARRRTTVTIDRATLEAGAFRAAMTGIEQDGALDLRWTLTLPSLTPLAPTLAGSALLHGEIRGALDNFGGSADGRATVAVHGSRPGAIDLAVRARGLPGNPSVTLEARGTLDDAPVRLAAAMAPAADGAVHAVLRQASWKSASASGDITFPAGPGPVRGRLAMQMADLQDLRRITGEPLQGSVTGTVSLLRDSGRNRAELQFEALRAGWPDRQIGHLLLSGRIDEPTSQPVFALRLVAEEVVTPLLAGNARLEALGPARSVALKLSSRWHADSPDAADVTATGTLDLPEQRLGVIRFEARYRGETARLLAPARLNFRDGVSAEAIRIGVREAVLQVAGSLSPVLDASASLQNASLGLLAIVRPDWRAEGQVTADARLTGTLGAPAGTVHLSAKGVRGRSGTGRAMPSTDIVATATLQGDSATVDLRVHADSAGDLRVTGIVPLRADQSLDLRADGQIALATANPFLEGDGRRAGGQVTIAATLKGTRSAPLIAGTALLSHGDFQDYVRGTHLSDISLTLEAVDRLVRVKQFTARSGPGTVSAEGTIGVLEPALPVDLRLTAVNAQPLSNDLLTARGDATLAIRGEARGRLQALGRIRVNRADIRIPNAYPREVAVLDVRRPGGKVAPQPRRGAVPIDLDVAIEAPRAIFVRGRGIDAELGGDLHVGGTMEAPQFGGGFDLRRGTLALAGASLRFSRGTVSFNGAGVRATLDPTLDLVADSTSTDVAATLTVAGYASAPTVVLTSTPELPQDEILARLLFGQSAKQLTPLQLVRIGVALSSISGSGYGGLDPLAGIQKRLGLDRLAVGGGSGPESNATTVEAGRYATERVYVGAAQSTTGATKLQVQVDLTKHLKLQTVVGSAGTAAQGTTPQNDPGNTIGLSYQIDY
jgi:translocation and assembly module TamB